MTQWESRLYRRIEELVASTDDDYYNGGARLEVADLENAVAATRGEVSAVRAELSGLRDSVTVLLGSVTDDTETALTGLRAQLEKLTSELRRYAGDNSAATATTEAMQRAVTEARDGLDERLAVLEDGLA